MSVTPKPVPRATSKSSLVKPESQVANALAVTPGLDIEKAMIAFELHQAGWKVHWPLFAGGHLWFEKEDKSLSYAAVKALLRYEMLIDRDCEQCGDPILTGESGAQRGTRTDRRFCSNACRQRAYRERRKQT